MLQCYFVVATLLNTGTFTAGETPAPVPLQQFNNIGYYITNNFTKEDYVKVYKNFGRFYDDSIIEEFYDRYDSYPKKSILKLETPKDAGGVYFLKFKLPGDSSYSMINFKLNENISKSMYSREVSTKSSTYLVEGDKLIHLLVNGDKTLKEVWEFSDDQVIETLESGSAKASRVWKVQKTLTVSTHMSALGRHRQFRAFFENFF